MTRTPGAPELSPEFWDSVKLATAESAKLYPYLTLLTLCTFALIFITIPAAAYAYTSIRKEQIRCGYLEKKHKADTALKKLGVKLAATKGSQAQRRRKRK